MIEKFKESLKGFSLTNYEDVGMGSIVFCFVLYIFLLLVFPCEPVDDLLRHMKSYTYGYDYRSMYPFSPGVPSWNMYYLFDVFAGKVHLLAGDYAFVIIQALVISVYFVGTWWLLKGSTSRNWRFAVSMISLALVFGRLQLARPSVFEGGLFLIALAACKEERFPWWGHFLIGCLMTSFYHLFFIYLIPLVLFRRIYLLSMAAGFGGWFAYAGTDYFHNIIRVLTIGSQRGGIKITEASPIYGAMLPHMYLLIPIIFYWRNDIKRLVAVGWFFLSNQVRYMEGIVPVLMSYAKHWEVKISQTVLIIIFISASCFRTVTTPSDSWKALSGVIPSNSKVLCLGYDSMFKLAFTGDKLRLSPCMDVGWDTNEVKEAILTANTKGTFNIGAFRSGTFDYVVESDLKEVPKGMELYKVAGKWRVWKPSTKNITRTLTINAGGEQS